MIVVIVLILVSTHLIHSMLDRESVDGQHHPVFHVEIGQSQQRSPHDLLAGGISGTWMS
ncbi:hypothetical protein NOJ28_21555 [Neorhizobium galegae]|uniref:hypothetical protein n=1 Tax=Neorhizobium galegae TaxID=399 RepID=UPI000621C7C8|nr:hypothetical protein [Neorhizobium galegae]MCQ1768129.1 hypothetical protein [Neorhizobium galegae]MCQ1847101.1 hypothetical protein [Neorhizobium galegae]CDZ29962.1 Hypothetical protein NGAL_HAMBI490_48300 [Neorhizobium galegae bv. officinalis]CDZ34179.1 Hypothetical protein NGAL_HAMBI1146_07330 [Neorhizobium galegae bv. officinalis]